MKKNYESPVAEVINFVALEQMATSIPSIDVEGDGVTIVEKGTLLSSEWGV